MKVEASAPGKLVLSGEYAVLAGAPAIVMAVNRRVTCRLTEGRGAGWRFVSSGHVADVALDKASVFAAPPATLPGVVRHLIDETVAPESFEVRIDSSACYLAGKKLGVGSSAAVVVALAAALGRFALSSRGVSTPPAGAPRPLPRAGGAGAPASDTLSSARGVGTPRGGGVGTRPSDTPLPATGVATPASGIPSPLPADADTDSVAEVVPSLQELCDIHRAFQGGGSGLDVAAAYMGGAIRFLSSSAQRPRTGSRGRFTSEALPLQLPEMHKVFVFTGSSTRTTDLLSRFDAWRDGRVPPELARLIDAARAVADCTGNAKTLLDALGEYCRVLQRMDRNARIGIYGPGHQSAAAIAMRCGVVYKPCGAGGGDTGVGLAASADAISRFQDGVRKAGLTILPLEIDHDGIQFRTP